MSPAEIEAVYPLSPAQAGLLYHTLSAPRPGIYVQQLHCLLRGKLDPAAFRRAWETLVARHAVLRTLVQARRDGEPLQLVRGHVALPWSQQDWRELTLAEQELRARAYLEADRAQGFDLSQAPLLRLLLAQAEDGCYHFFCTLHHLILDGWSTASLLGEAFALHRALRRGEPPRLLATRPFRDYVLWLGRQEVSSVEERWREALAGFVPPPPLPLGATGAAGSASGGRSGEVRRELSAASTAQLHAAARRHGLPPNSFVQAAWALLLHRYQGAADVLYGVTVSGRSAELAGVETMVGLLINTLPVRARLVPGEPLVSWVKRLYAQQVELFEVEFLPLSQIQAWSRLPREALQLESILVFEDYAGNTDWQRRDEELAVVAATFHGQTSYPLTVLIEPGPCLRLRLLHDPARCVPAAASRLLEHLTGLLEEIAVEPQRPLAEFSLLSPAQRHQCLVEWNDTAAPYPEACIHQLVERQARRWPDRPALDLAGARLTLGELNSRANLLAHHLISLGVGPDMRVGICVRPSTALVIGLLGILKSGAAYVPLEPDHPRERLACMIEESQIFVLLTEEALLDGLPAHWGKVFCLDADWPAIVDGSAEDPPLRSAPDGLAYIVFTSGSTGQPKGIAIAHRGVVRLVCGADYVRLTPADVVAQASNAAFDAATFEIWGALLNGAELVGIDREDSLDPRRLAARIESRGINTLFLTTPLFNQVATAGCGLGALEHLLFGGEAVDPRSVRRVLVEQAPGRLLHVYGPTESTTFTTSHRVREVPAGAETVPIGRPISNTRVYLLDERFEPLPIGAAGELCIGGDGLARGYLNRPELTAASFVPDRFGAAPGGRLYRTGDLARFQPDGNIEFIGRRDHQVKLRGFRIELEEIESVLLRSPLVRQAAALLREDGEGGQELVAYVVAEDPEALLPAEDLRSFLREKLPAYMVPGVLVAMSALPLNANGKVDRRALPAPAAARLEVSRGSAPPRNELERLIVAIWQEVLKLDSVGVESSFFDLGGHSLSLIKVVNRLQQTLGREVSVTEMFEFPTVAALAAHLSGEAVEESFAAVQDRMAKQRRALGRQARGSGERGRLA